MSRVAARRRPPVPLPDRPSRARLAWRRLRRMVRPGAATLIFLAAGFGILLLSHALNRGGSVAERFGNVTARLGLRVDHVIVEGRQKTPEPLLRAALGISRGDPVLTYSLSAARARVETIQWVQQATIARLLPSTIKVTLKERSPFAVWQENGKFRLVDRAGQVVTDSDVATFANQLPLVVGAGAPQAAAALIDALQAQPDLAGRVVAAVRVSDRRWNLRMKNGIDVLLPEDDTARALQRLAALQSGHQLLDRPLQVVDLRLPDRLVIRPTASPMPASAGAVDTRRPT